MQAAPLSAEPSKATRPRKSAAEPDAPAAAASKPIGKAPVQVTPPPAEPPKATRSRSKTPPVDAAQLALLVEAQSEAPEKKPRTPAKAKEAPPPATEPAKPAPGKAKATAEPQPAPAAVPAKPAEPAKPARTKTPAADKSAANPVRGKAKSDVPDTPSAPAAGSPKPGARPGAPAKDRSGKSK